ncbi:hypothetical protein M2152_002784 [Microbacteriaceae bacterium SG_E_30_P1]|uniref:YtxH domain-containing protein n=1 Tax=Antiquaquibacter oligotrophicus TaxID=2880260 RepID=A0ABT6KRJ6_9MICO|nr:hypothetical protein [Antiquaquibacter oligotrophicus]MDH6182602.1 hypothetical protein [Antiquaquibacter oligotrophicus]UDF14433.1 hypothetical protein LH407_06115 [Antiquaquibacter oligotrophicus]
MKSSTGLLVLGAIAAIAFAATPKGRELVSQGRRKVEHLWSDAELPRTMADAREQVRRVPVVGERIAGSMKAAS